MYICVHLWDDDMKRVQFNDDLVALHRLMMEDKFTTQTFEDFVRDAFHDKVDELRMKARSTISNETVEEICKRVQERLAPKATQ